MSRVVFGCWVRCKERTPLCGDVVLVYRDRDEDGHVLAADKCYMLVCRYQNTVDGSWFEVADSSGSYGGDVDDPDRLDLSEVGWWMPVPQAPECSCAMDTKARDAIITCADKASLAVLDFAGSVCNALEDMTDVIADNRGGKE